MNVRILAGKVAALASLGLMAITTNACAQGEKMTEAVYESGYTTPLPLREGGEKIDVLVRVKDKERGHNFYLVFVEKKNWPKEKKDSLRRMYQGGLIADTDVTPYPVKLRFRLESLDGVSDAHVDQVVSERVLAYVTRDANRGAEIWRAHQIYYGGLEPGVYRVRIDNLAPAPEIDFETLFQFERDNRKY